MCEHGRPGPEMCPHCNPAYTPYEQVADEALNRLFALEKLKCAHCGHDELVLMQQTLKGQILDNDPLDRSNKYTWRCFKCGLNTVTRGKTDEVIHDRSGV
jgi:hypothetical protein